MNGPLNLRAPGRILCFVLLFGACCWNGAGWGYAPTGYVERTPTEEGFLTAGAVGCSLVYTPIKACYAAGGTVAGGLVFLMSAGQSATAAGRILERSTRGDWYVHPDHLTGERQLRFRGSPHIGGGRGPSGMD